MDVCVAVRANTVWVESPPLSSEIAKYPKEAKDNYVCPQARTGSGKRLNGTQAKRWTFTCRPEPDPVQEVYIHV